MMKMNRKNGISLIMLVISIVVICILANAIILSFSNNNPVSQASKVAFMHDVESFKCGLDSYNSRQAIDKPRGYSSSKLQADENSVTYNGVVDNNKTINDIIPLLGSMPKYYGLFEIVDGKLIFVGIDTTQKEWAGEIGIGLISASRLQVTIISASEMLVKPGTDIVFTIEFSSNAGLSTIDLINKIEVLDNNGTVLSTQPTFVIGSISGTALDCTRSVDITIQTASLSNGTYKLRIKAGAATNKNDISNIIDTTSLTSFNIDNIAPVNPIMLASPTGWTNGNVSVTITFSADSTTRQYSTNGTTWNIYTTPVIVSTNNTTVYSKAIDTAGNQNIHSTLTVANIDKVVPTVVYGTNGDSGETASSTVTVSDTGGSNINTSTLQYIWDTQNISTPSSGWSAFTNGATITNGNTSGTYYLWIKSSDNAGNILVSKSNAFTLIQLEIANKPLLPTGMTPKKWNGSIWETVASPDTDTTWYNYTNSQWANAQTADGSMWVWIPRYVYKISSLWHSSSLVGGNINIQFSKGTNDNWNSGVIGSLNTDTSANASNNTWTNHPAFTFGTTELTGIWVAKFEASDNNGKVKVIPNIASWKSITVNDIFNACRAMETDSTYGWGTSGTGIDTHMIKNIEWGAVAYLAQSVYGTHGVEVWMNPDRDRTTGRAGAGVTSSETRSTYTYDDLTYGVNASTTKNIYGVYDMSGGSYEYTAAYVNNGDIVLATYSLSLVNADIKYKDLYTVTTDVYTQNYLNSIDKKGDAIYETSSTSSGSSAWFSDYSYMPSTNTMFLCRGGYSSNTTAGLFNFSHLPGCLETGTGFRPILAVSPSL